MFVALLVALVGATGVAAPATAAAPVPKVALIVGPVGSITDRYRALADSAAKAAQAAGAEVVKVYSPNATWPAVKSAVTGASIVVYLGHGNGWPSRYRDSLYPPSQNGFGLNPVAGGDDSKHQYFGEKSVGRLKLASNAVVVLSHLCYASGNSEPGLAEGTLDQAVQRVDNYAAGFLRAGARAVVAEAYLGPAYYVKALLRGRGSVERIWTASPTANGRHGIAVASVRTPGYAVRLDPERANGGFVRSLVTKGVTADELRAGATGRLGGAVLGPTTGPTLAATGIRFGEPAFAALPIVGTKTRLTLPLAKGKAKQIPAGAQVSVRWDPILLDAPPAPEPAVAPAPSPEPSPTSEPAPTIDPNAIARFERPHAPTIAPEGSLEPTPSQTATSTLDPTLAQTPTSSLAPSPDPASEAPEVDLVVPEQIGSVVKPVRASRGAGGLGLGVTYPEAPGLYRLTATLHTPEGVAYDAATQALLVPVLVRVGGAMAVAYGAPATLSATAGISASLPVRVLNAGASRWDQVIAAPLGRVDTDSQVGLRTTTLPPSLVATWVSADGLPVPDPLSVRLDNAVSAPGGTSDVILELQPPAGPGTYLLLLDVLTPENGPISAMGGAPAIVRVTVNAAAPTPPSPRYRSPRSSEPLGAARAGCVTSNVVPGFLPSVHGLAFANAFPPGPTLRLGPFDSRMLGFGDASSGLCGGMALTARDLFEAGCAAPDDQRTPPENGSPRFRALVRRQVESLDWMRVPLRYLDLQAWRPDPPSGLALRLRREPPRVEAILREWPRIRAEIDVGHPSVDGAHPATGISPWTLTGTTRCSPGPARRTANGSRSASTIQTIRATTTSSCGPWWRTRRARRGGTGSP